MTPSYYRSIWLQLVVLFLITQQQHKSRAFSITRVANSTSNEQNDSTLSGSTLQEVVNTYNNSSEAPVDAELIQVKPALKSTNESTGAPMTITEQEKNKNNISVNTWFTLTTKISFINDTTEPILKTSTEKYSTPKQNDENLKIDHTEKSTSPDAVVSNNNQILQGNLTIVKNTLPSIKTNSNGSIEKLDEVPKYDDDEKTNSSYNINNKLGTVIPAIKEYKNIDRRKKIDEKTQNLEENNITSPAQLPSILNTSNEHQENYALESENTYYSTAYNDKLSQNSLNKDVNNKTLLTKEDVKKSYQKQVTSNNDMLANITIDMTETQKQMVETKTNEQSWKENAVIQNAELKRKDGIKKAEEKVNEEDKLSVQPITTESKNKSSSLYVVNSNYKRPKKLEIAQPKSFKRDPNDNTWRNESISSLGIVFKANNASKPFTLVIKNKTESELNTTLQKFEKEDRTIELKERLEKLSERRKSKKKRPGEENKTDDYEGFEGATTANSLSMYNYHVQDHNVPQELQTPFFDIMKTENIEKVTTTPISNDTPKQLFDFFQDFETMINKEKVMSTEALQTQKTAITMSSFTTTSRPLKQYTPERKATLEYFPPKETTTTPKTKRPPLTAENKLDEKLNQQHNTDKTTTVFPISLPPINSNLDYGDRYLYVNQIPLRTTIYYNQLSTIKDDPNNKKTHYTDQRDPNHSYSIVNDEGGSIKDSSYVVKHFRESADDVSKPRDYDKDADRETFIPTYGNRDRIAISQNEYDVGKTGENYADNAIYYPKYNRAGYPDSGKEYPVLYNSTIVHRTGGDRNGVLASSMALMKRLYEVQNPQREDREPTCEPNCERYTVELSPEYELHYYVPEQEERGEAEDVRASLRRPSAPAPGSFPISDYGRPVYTRTQLRLYQRHLIPYHRDGL